MKHLIYDILWGFLIAMALVIILVCIGESDIFIYNNF